MEEHSGSTKWKTKVYNEVRAVDQTVISLSGYFARGKYLE